MARRDGGFLFRFFGSAGFSYGVDRGDSPIAGSRTCSSGDAHSDILVAIGRQCVSLKRQQKPAALTGLSPFSRARGGPRRHRSWSRRWRAATADFFFGFSAAPASAMGSTAATARSRARGPAPLAMLTLTFWWRLAASRLIETKQKPAALTGLSPFSRARGGPRRHRSWSRRWRAATADFFFGFSAAPASAMGSTAATARSRARGPAPLAMLTLTFWWRLAASASH